MSKETTPKIGTIRFTEREQEIIAVGVESEFFKLIERKFRPQRQTKIALTALNASLNMEDLSYYKGQSSESDWLVNELRRVAEKFNKKNLDADTDGIDE